MSLFGFNFGNAEQVEARTNGFTQVRPGAGSTIDGTVVSRDNLTLLHGTQFETEGSVLGIRDRQGRTHQVDVYGPLNGTGVGMEVHYRDHSLHGMLHQEIVELGSVGYKPAIEHLTPMKVVRQAYGAIVDTEF